MDDLLTIDPINMQRKAKTTINCVIHVCFRSASVFVTRGLFVTVFPTGLGAGGARPGVVVVVVGGTRAYAEAGVGVTSPELGGSV